MGKTNISDLKRLPELFIMIFERMKSSEIFKMAEVCKYWKGITQHAACLNKNTSIVNITCEQTFAKDDDDLDIAFELFLNTCRKFQFKLEICGLSLSEKYFQFAEKFSENISEIILTSRKFHIEEENACLPGLDVLIPHLTKLINLRKLTLSNCKFANKNFPVNSDTFSNLTSLHLECLWCESTDTSLEYFYNHYNYFLTLTPNLKSLYFKVSLKNQDVVVEYLKNTTITQSLRELYLFSDIADFLSIKHLNLDKFALESFGDIVDNSYVDDLETFLISQKNLKYLDLNIDEPFLTQVIRICSLLNNLEHLALNCAFVTEATWCNINLEAIWQLKHLELSCANSHIFQSLKNNSKMKSLTLYKFNFNTDGADDLKECIEKFAFLTNLKCFKYDAVYILEDDIVEGILKHLINLQELYLHETYCRNVDSYINKRTDFIISSVCNGHCNLYMERLSSYSLPKYENDNISDKKYYSKSICEGNCHEHLERLIRLPGTCKNLDAEET